MSPAPWPEIIPISDQVEAAPFPTDSLPQWLRHYVSALATANQVPEDMVGMLVLSALSTAVQGRIDVTALPGVWKEPVTLFTATAMEPGERKTPTFDSVFAPLVAWETEIQEIERPIVAESQQLYRGLEMAVEKADQRVSKMKTAHLDALRSDDTSPDQERAALADHATAEIEARDARTALDAFERRWPLRLVYNDLTPEAAAQHLSEQYAECIAVISDEGGVFEVMTGSRYAEKMNLDVFLKGHSGGALRVDRIARESERIDRAMITLGVAVQPSVLRDMGRLKILNGRGFLARILYAVPVSMIGRRQTRVNGVPAEILEAYADGMKRIAAAAYQETQIRLMPMSNEAEEALRVFLDEVEPRFLEESGDLAEIRNWASKLAGQLVRIASLLSCARNRDIDGEIEAEDFDSALHFAPYLIAHAFRAHTLMGLIEISEMENKIVKKVQSNGFSEFTTREMYRMMNAHRNGGSASEFEATLDDLVNMGYLRKIVDSVKPPKYHWMVNPAVHSTE